MQADTHLKLKLPDDFQRSFAAINDSCHQLSKLSGAASSSCRTLAAALQPLSTRFTEISAKFRVGLEEARKSGKVDFAALVLSSLRTDEEEFKGWIREFKLGCNDNWNLDPSEDDVHDTRLALYYLFYELTIPEWPTRKAYIRTAVTRFKKRLTGQWDNPFNKQQKNRVPLDSDLTASSESSPDHELMSEASKAELFADTQQLCTPQQRQLVKLLLQGKTIAQAAEILDTTENVLWVQMFRLREKARKRA